MGDSSEQNTLTMYTFLIQKYTVAWNVKAGMHSKAACYIFVQLINIDTCFECTVSIITLTHLSVWRGRTQMCCPPCYSSTVFAWTDTDTPWCLSLPPLLYKPYGPDRAGRASSDPETGPSAGCREAVLQWCTSPVFGWGSWLKTWESKTKHRPSAKYSVDN